jgi:choline dehydrogenase-like flavoprotein
MAGLRDQVGIRFIEAMSGYVRGSGEKWIRPDDAGHFSYQAILEIPSLNAFLAGPLHIARVAGGTVEWKPFVQPTAILPGQVTMFRNDNGNRKHKFFDFDFSFASGVGYDIRFEGHKDLKDDRPFDASTDMTTVFCTLHAKNRPIARGVLHVNLSELLLQVQSMTVTGATSADEEREAREAFFAFFNRVVREVYPYVPLLLKEEARLTREELETLRFCARLMLPDPLPADGPGIDDVVNNLERFVGHAPESQVRDIRNALQAAGIALPALGVDPRDVRDFVKRELRRASPSPVRDVLEQIHTLIAFPYYSHPKADAIVGYHRPRHVPRAETRLPVLDVPPEREFDVVIAGSGPAGALLAERISAQGKSVLLLEEGPYVAEPEIDADELLWTSRLYKRSALQRANEPESIFDTGGPSFMVLQGGCVGGGSVVNNAVCFRLPARRLERWRNAGFPLDAAALDSGFDATARDLSIGPVSARARRLNPAARYLDRMFGPPQPPPVDEFAGAGFWECLVNLEPLGEGDQGCLGIGLCNVGCGSGRKRNALQVYLPKAVANGATIVAGARVLEVRSAQAAGGERRADGLLVRLRDGRKVIVRGRQFVLSCGPIGSTEVLLRSGDLKDHFQRERLPVGRRFAANVGSPLFAFTHDTINDQPGLQIAHAFVPFGNDGFVMETWYNPPGANALAMPGYLDVHHQRMRAFAQTVAAAPLVGSLPSGRISLEEGRLRIRLPIGVHEMDYLADGLSLLAGAFIEGGVREVVAGIGAGFVAKTQDDAARLRDEVRAIARNPRRQHLLRVGTGHPQGGNAMSEDPNVGVVDASFRVRGFSNLRVCDGSIFPDSSGVNPQWTILALADRCAEVVRQTVLAGGVHA